MKWSMLQTALTASVLASLVAVTVPAWGQRNDESASDGRPAPRTADGRPDLSGIWNKGLTIDSARGLDLAFTAYGRERFEAAKNEIDPQALCLFPGVPRIMNAPYPFQIVQLPDKVIFLYEALHNFRIVPTDGRGHPEELVPALLGHSVGRWEGDVLVVETIGLTDRTWLDDSGNQHSDELRVVERYERIDYDTLAYGYTIDDPKMYTEPWTVPMRHIPLAPEDWQLMEYACTDYNKVVEDGLLGPSGVPPR